MKSKIILVGAMLCAITTTGAHAVTKCVKLAPSRTTCTANYSEFSGKADWTATCTTSGTKITVQGIGVCSSTNGGTRGATADTLAISSDASRNEYCWCKMISPANSKWTYQWFGVCPETCALTCAGQLQSNLAFRNGLLSSFSD